MLGETVLEPQEIDIAAIQHAEHGAVTVEGKIFDPPGRYGRFSCEGNLPDEIGENACYCRRQ